MKEQRIKYPVGVQTFSKLIEGGYLYVDKTRFINDLINGGRYYFLSRPRRFGKSLLLSTIEAYYQGRRDLFKGLALDTLTDEWESRPVLHLDLNVGKYDTPEALDDHLSHILHLWEMEYGLTAMTHVPGQRFGDVIRQVSEQTGRKVVILIDEYDKPLLSAIDDEKLSDEYRSTLKSFYGNLKTQDRYIEFAMLTGVARFGRVSIFSDLNNLRDISFDPNYADICGITNQELDAYFKDGIEELAQNQNKIYSDIREELKTRYDGYHFSINLIDIYNPFSLVNVFASGMIKNYWFASGTPTYLVSLLTGMSLKDLEHTRIEVDALENGGILSHQAIPSLYQTGYLTIKGYDSEFEEYILDYPNREVEDSFIRFLKPYYLGVNSTQSEFDTREFVKDVVNGNVESFMTRLDSMLRGIPHIGKEGPHEHTFQNAIYLIFKMVGVYTRMEDHTSNGRIDLTVETDRYVYVFEFKVDKTAREAMGQILEKEYWKKFLAKGKTIFLVAANYSTDQKAISDLLIDTIEK